MSGRPLRFLAAVCGGWIGLRVFLLWPTIDSAPALFRAIVPAASAKGVRIALRPVGTIRPERPPVAAVARADAAPAPASAPAPEPGASVALSPGPSPVAAASPVSSVIPGVPKPAPLREASTKRLSGSAWAIGRGAGGASVGLVGGQLGGSQAGVRLAYLLDVRHRIAAAARLTSPLSSGLREAAVGIEWQPTRLPVRIVAEERVALNGGAAAAPAIGVVGGLVPTAIGLGFRLEGYGQAGMIGRTGVQGFIDGALRVAHPLAAAGGVRVDLGGGLWGAAQRGARRVDIGPSLAVVLPVARQAVRLSLDWRERVGGNARPGSGPAVSLGADF